jgi:alkylation response protein AidB-like acyl-CoA dehydrogenase
MRNETETDGALIAAAREIASIARTNADRSERERTLAAPVVSALEERGVFRMLVPREGGGGEASPLALIDVIEEIARGDGAAGWCAMIAATTGVLAAYLGENTAREVFASSNAVGGVFAPMGRAVAVDGGFRVSGRWAFASGSPHCAWLSGGCVLFDGDSMRKHPSGAPMTRMFFFPRASCEILDTWDTSGLRGTGSHDIAVADLLVPEDRSVSITEANPRATGPLYAFPVFGLLAVGVASVTLGIARNAIESFRDLATKKTPMGSRASLAQRGVIQSDVAQSDASLRAGRALLRESVLHAWERARAGERFDVAERASLRLAAAHAVASATRAVDAMYTAAGGSAIYARSPLQRCFRDVHTATQHVMVAAPVYELVGRILLGVDADTTLL